MDFPRLAEISSYVATVLGIPLGIWVFVSERGKDRESLTRERAKDREQRELDTFTRITDGYVDYLKQCLEMPAFSYYALGGFGGRKLSEEETKEYLRFEILICNLELAYYLYKDQSQAFKKRQWVAWNRYILAWCKVPWFQKHWTPEFATYYDAEFSNHVSELVKQVSSERKT